MRASHRITYVLPLWLLSLALAGIAPYASARAQDSSASNTAPSYSSSLGLPLTLSTPEPTPGAYATQAATVANYSRTVRPFSAFAIAVKGGIAGIGFDLATPLAQRFNLRGGASFFSYSDSYLLDGTTANGDLKLRSVGMSLDWYPFNNRFRISPGVTLYNGNNLNASAMVPGGQTFELDDATYTSSTADPIRGSASFTFGNRTAPSLTIGAGNMIPRHGSGHFSIPFEIGFQYISDPHITLALQGTACTNGLCQNTATYPQFQSNLQAENVDLNNDIRPLRFFPIASIGVGYKF